MGVHLHDITCRFGRTPAVEGISLELDSGEFLGLVGPSGAGKTTLLRIIAGLETKYSGQLSIGRRDVTNVPARARNIGFVFQNYALFPHMSIAENVAFGLRVRPRAMRPRRHLIAARVRELLELVQVEKLATRLPAQLSGGQRQRVALARALATEPELLLLDEPFGALDPLVRKEIRTWLRGLHDRLGLTSIMVTHDQSEALEVADRIALLRDGRLEQLGTPEELEARPATAFVHRFLGETVSLDGVARGGILHPDAMPGIQLELRRMAGRTMGDGRVCASIRPYEIGIVPQGHLGGHAAEAMARVATAHRAGAFTRYGVRLSSTEGAAGTIEVLASAVQPVLIPGTACMLDFTQAKIFSAGGRAIDTQTPIAPAGMVPAEAKVAGLVGSVRRA